MAGHADTREHHPSHVATTRGPDREALVRRLDPWAARLARSYSRGRADTDDLLQVARIGAIKAVDRFDPRRGRDLIAFALPTMRGEIRHHMRATWQVHLPRGIQELCWRLPTAEEQLWQELQRKPTDEEIGRQLGTGAAQIAEARAARHAAGTIAWETPGTSEPGTVTTLADRVGGEDHRYRRVEELSAVRDAMRQLRATERDALRMAFLEERSQREIGRHLGCSQMQVSRIVRRSLDQLHDALAA